MQNLGNENGNGKQLLAEAAMNLRAMAANLSGKILIEKQLREKYGDETIDCILRNVRLHLGTYRAVLQWDVLLFLLSEMTEKIQQEQEEEIIGNAIQELLDTVSELPKDEQAGVYHNLAESIKCGSLAVL